jgi:uncharacterized protein (DUF362 family)
MEAERGGSSRRKMIVDLLRLGAASTAVAGLGFWLSGRSLRPEEPLPAKLKPDFSVPPDPNLPLMVIAHGDDPRQLVREAVKKLGGIERFIARGDTVVLKPNIAWDRIPEQAANTNPDIVAEMVRLCSKAGAGKVIVTDVSCNDPRRCFERSGIAAAAHREGAEVVLPSNEGFREVDLGGEVLRSWPVLEPFLTADKVVNIPIAKSHSLTGVTLGMKNWYGILGGQRQRLHQRIDESIVDLAAFMRPTLTIIDAYRVLVRNGPTGGNLEDVALKKTLIAGTDPVALDACAARTCLNMDGRMLGYLRLAAARGLGTLSLENVRTEVATLK